MGAKKNKHQERKKEMGEREQTTKPNCRIENGDEQRFGLVWFCLASLAEMRLPQLRLATNYSGTIKTVTA